MKKQTEDRIRPVAPVFETEAEEAAWWYKNRNLRGKGLLAAVKSGDAQVLTKEQLQKRLVASKEVMSPVVVLRIPQADIAFARRRKPSA